MQAFLVTVPPVYQVNGKTVPPGDSQVMYDKDWGHVLSSEAQTLRQALTSIDVIHVPFNSGRRNKERETRIFMQRWYVVVVILVKAITLAYT